MSITRDISRGVHFREEHEIFFREVRRFAETELLPHREEWEKTGGIPKWVDKRMGDLGYFGLRIPEEDGGHGCDFFFAVALAEGLAYSGMPALMTTGLMAIDMYPSLLHAYGTKEQKENYLLPLIKGEKRSAIGITEPDAGSDVAAIETRARLEGDSWVINGRKTFITNGDSCDFCVLLARTSGEGGQHRGLSLFLVDRDTPGYVVVRRLSKVGLKQMDTCELAFDDCRIPRGNLVGEEGKGFYLTMGTLDAERLTTSAFNIARAQVAFEEGVRYSQERIQFGRPIGEFQVIRHKIADMAVELEAARQLVYHAAWLYDQHLPVIKETCMAKFKAANVCWKVMDTVFQIYSAYAYIDDTPISHYWRDARMGRIAPGTDEIQLEIIANSILPRVRGK